jgi:hypothetical protein
MLDDLVTIGAMNIPYIRYWLPAFLAIECLILITLVRMNGVFFHVGIDFLPSYAGARMLIDGGRHDLYDTFLQWHRQQPVLNQYGAAWDDRMLQPYVAPPLLAILTVPLLVLSPLVAWITWGAMNIAAAVAAVSTLARRLGIEWSTIAFVVLGSFPLFYTVLLGQVEGILLLAMVIFVLELRRGNDVRAALALSVLALKPQLLVAPLLFIAVTGRRRAVITTIVAGIAQLAVSTLVIGVSGMREYVAFGRRLSQPEGIAATNVPGMVNIRAIVVRAFPGWDTPLVDMGILAGSVALLGLAGYLWWRLGHEATSAPALALLMTTMLLTAYHALYHTAIFATLGAIFLVEAAYRRGDVAGARRIVGLTWLFFAFLPLLPFLVVQSSRAPAMISTLGIMLLWGSALRQVIGVLQGADLLSPASDPHREPQKAEVHVRD